MKHRNRVPGFTLAETMVYCVLLGLFTSIFFVSLPTRDNASSEDLATCVEQTSLALTRLQKGIGNSSRDKVYVRDGGKTILFLSATDENHPNFVYDKSGNVLWRHWDYFTLENNQVSHYQIPLDRIKSLAEVGDPTAEKPSRTYARRSLVRDVSNFQVQKVNSDYRVVLELALRGSTYGSETLARPRN
jgi:hypothetical protein